jgi:hypothetical protein
LLALHAGVTEPKPDSDAIFAGVVERVATSAASALGKQLEALTASAPSLAAFARSAGAACTNAVLNTDLTRQKELRRFLEWAGFFSDAPAPLTMGPQATPSAASPQDVTASTRQHVPLDTMVAILTSKPEMHFAEGERDMALMQHELEV